MLKLPDIAMVYLKHTCDLGYRDIGQIYNFGHPKLTPPRTIPPECPYSETWINWISVLPSLEHQVLPSCQGLRDQAWSPELECSLPSRSLLARLGRGKAPHFLSFPRVAAVGTTSPSNPFQSRQRASAEPILKAQSQAQKEKSPLPRRPETGRKPDLRATPPRVEEGASVNFHSKTLGSQNGKLSEDHPGAQPRRGRSSLQDQRLQVGEH